MNDQKKAKWILGTSGVALSALLLTQFSGVTESNSSTLNNNQFTEEQENNMTEREKELVNLDWTNFDVVSVDQQQQQQTSFQSDRQSRRS